jgi:hypothetical protein
MKAGNVVSLKRISAAAAVIVAGAAAGALALSGAFAGAASASVQTNCVAVPHVCGFPDATNTGVPAGMSLKTVPGQVSSGPGWHYDSRGWVSVTGDGTVLSGLYIPYTLDISASNVTVKDVKVVTSGQSSFGISVRHTSNVTIQDSTISGVDADASRLMVGVKDIYGDSTGLAVLRDNIAWAGVGVQMEAGLIQDDYIHDMGFIAGDHIDGTTSNGGGTGLLTIQHNTILVNRSQTTAVGLFEDFGAQVNRVINNNLLAGGGYAIYAGQNSGGPVASNIVVTNNRISTIYYPLGGQYGPVTALNRTATGNTWSGNVWDNTGQAIPSA